MLRTAEKELPVSCSHIFLFFVQLVALLSAFIVHLHGRPLVKTCPKILRHFRRIFLFIHRRQSWRIVFKAMIVIIVIRIPTILFFHIIGGSRIVVVFDLLLMMLMSSVSFLVH